jgi:hypothetical protein
MQLLLRAEVPENLPYDFRFEAFSEARHGVALWGSGWTGYRRQEVKREQARLNIMFFRSLVTENAALRGKGEVSCRRSRFARLFEQQAAPIVVVTTEPIHFLVLYGFIDIEKCGTLTS